MKVRLTAISFFLAQAAGIYLCGAPVYTGFRDNQPVHTTLAEVNGAWIIVPVKCFLSSSP
jgi:hypothetical protein